MIIAGIFFVSAIFVTILATPLVIRWSATGHGLDQPDAFRKRHRAPIPRLGGLPLFVVFITGFILITNLQPSSSPGWAAIGICSGLIFILGLWDDFKPLGAKAKLAGQILIALTAHFMGLGINVITWPLGHFSMELGEWSLPLTVFWLVAIPNLVNLIDGIDGLASGVGLFLFITLGFVGWVGGQFGVTWISFGMAGALLGFLCFNFPPARIFLGDGGAYLIGFVIASLSLASSNKGTIAAALLVTTVALGLPIMDTTFALLRRAVRGFPLFQADAEHIHHRLTLLGLSDRRVVLGMYLISVVLSLVGLSVLWTQGRSLPVAGGLVFVLAIFAVRYLGYIWTWAELTTQIRRALSRRTDVKYTLLLAQLLEMEVGRCRNRAEFDAIFLQMLVRAGFSLHGSGEMEGRSPILLETRNSPPLTLYVPSEQQDNRYWKRMANCFRHAYQKAGERWDPEQIPK
ncbi:MAG: MraY family glycosyltransferase [Methylacidiphilales bacterium]|nr:MraY family glycosyltransferase [Candidatus Methylacidiphilales bacterium]